MCFAEDIQRTKKNETPVMAHSLDKCSRKDKAKNHRQHIWYDIYARSSSGMMPNSLEIDRKIVYETKRRCREGDRCRNKSMTHRQQETCYKRKRMLLRMRPIFMRR
jgi:hypothetical protein